MGTCFGRETRDSSGSRAPAAVTPPTATYSKQATKRSLALSEFSVNECESLRHVTEAPDRPKKAGRRYKDQAWITRYVQVLTINGNFNS